MDTPVSSPVARTRTCVGGVAAGTRRGDVVYVAAIRDRPSPRSPLAGPLYRGAVHQQLHEFRLRGLGRSPWWCFVAEADAQCNSGLRRAGFERLARAERDQ